MTNQARVTVNLGSILPTKYQLKHMDCIINSDLNCVHIDGNIYWVVEYLEDLLLWNEEINELYMQVDYITKGEGDYYLQKAIVEMLEDYTDQEELEEFVSSYLDNIVTPLEVKML